MQDLLLTQIVRHLTQSRGAGGYKGEVEEGMTTHKRKILTSCLQAKTLKRFSFRNYTTCYIG